MKLLLCYLLQFVLDCSLLISKIDEFSGIIDPLSVSNVVVATHRVTTSSESLIAGTICLPCRQ
jgi:hypothetical protein